MKKNKRTCQISKCQNSPYLGGLCKEHHLENLKKSERRENAIIKLHQYSLDDLPVDKELCNEFKLLREYWNRACFVEQTNRGIELMPKDEAHYALDWCISLAQEIIDADLAIREGKKISYSLENTRRWVWDRFKNLDAGLRSNGTEKEIKN